MEMSLRNWLAFLFDRPVPYRWSEESGQWPDNSEQIACLIAETFEHSGELLARYSDPQLDQGFQFLLDAGGSEFMFSLVRGDVPLPVRLRALRSFVPLFQQVMAVRCSAHLSHLDWPGSSRQNEPGEKPLNGICYMWWDALPIHGRPDLPERAEFDAEALVVLERLLVIPHDACHESALHGIGHWANYYPQVAAVVDNFLAQTPTLRPELVAYARSARMGGVQ